MSCRVLQRGVESFAMNNIFAYAARLGAKRVVGHYIPTAKNEMVKGFFKASASRGSRTATAARRNGRWPSTPISRARCL